MARTSRRTNQKRNRLPAALRERMLHMLRDPVWSKRTNVWIGKELGIHEDTVGRYRRRLGQSGSTGREKNDPDLARKKDRVRQMLNDPEWATRSTRWIAAEAGVNHATVERIRAQIGQLVANPVRNRPFIKSPATFDRVAALCKDPTWSERSCASIAKEAAVSTVYVRKVRAMIGATPRFTIGRDGKKYAAKQGRFR